MGNKLVIVSLVVFCGGCSSQGAWRTYSPAMSDLVGAKAQLVGDEIVVGEKVSLEGGKVIEITEREGPGDERVASSSEKSAALDIAVNKLKIELGGQMGDVSKTAAKNIKIDVLNNWEWVPSEQSFVYGGLRADSVDIDFSSSYKLSVGEFEYPEIGRVSISAKGDNSYRATISNPKVYYRLQMARTEITFPAHKYSNGWVTKGDPKISPLRLSPNGKSETWDIEPHQWFWDRWFGSEMPKLRLVLDDGQLFVRAKGAISSNPIPLKSLERNGRWKDDSVYILSIDVGDFEKKLVILDIEAEREGDDVLVSNARIRYPEVKLSIDN